MKADPVEVQEFLKLLEKTARRIEVATKGVDEMRLHFKLDTTQWSANDILAHLRSCADVWGDSIEKMIAKDKQTLPYVHPRQWVKKTDYANLSFRISFQAFKTQRGELLKVLKDLSFEDWSRGAIIQGREHTVFTQTRRMATHENVHCDQIEEMLK